MKELEGYEPYGWFWILEVKPWVCHSYLMDDFGNAVPYNYAMTCARQISLTY